MENTNPVVHQVDELLKYLRNTTHEITVCFRPTVGVIGEYHIATVYPYTLMLRPVYEGKELWIPNPTACQNVVIKTFPDTPFIIVDITIDDEWQIHFKLPQGFQL